MRFLRRVWRELVETIAEVWRWRRSEEECERIADKYGVW